MQDKFKYTKHQNQVTITRYTGSETAVEVPNEIDDAPVTAIGNWAFENCSSLTAIQLPASLTAIGV